MTVRCIANVTDAYKRDTKTQRTFRKHAAQPYDARIFRFLNEDAVSIGALSGRERISCVTGEHQRALLKYRKGEVDLMRVRGVFYTACVCDIEAPGRRETSEVLGVDFGSVHLATDSRGKNDSGEAVALKRRISVHRRRNLQRKGTRAAKRADTNNAYDHTERKGTRAAKRT